jgi:putative mRNA 3-end processing factor
LLQLTDAGLYCPAGDFHIDPWRPVDRAVITHAHSDHARGGSARYLCSREGESVSRARLGPDVSITSASYGETLHHNGVALTFHPAGHILGSAQIRLEFQGEVWVVSGDYKTVPDPTCTAFEPVRCHTFVTESTFGLPIYRWPTPSDVFAEINAWWRGNQEAGRVSLLFGYALGKAQRLLAGLDQSIGPIYTHGAVERLTQAYRASGIELPATTYVGLAERGTDWKQALVLAPPSAHGTPWARKFGPASTALASGWMRIRGARRRRAFDRGPVLSDHADWPGLLDAIGQTGADRVWVTHGYTAVLVRWLKEKGIDAHAVATQFEGESAEAAVAEETDLGASAAAETAP